VSTFPQKVPHKKFQYVRMIAHLSLSPEKVSLSPISQILNLSSSVHEMSIETPEAFIAKSRALGNWSFD
jgi:hypothetical protein